ncbi:MULTISPECIES: DUF6465 family protein [Caproicibacterium]|jgi:ElaB/YqjD/DUF883 family membrane-anchored ribosome-binding protein|uniref:Uncharacterized protein n=1 Tax=Caproicibacterium lactatifermentans TaxID=2666138 RepID=A0A859DM12_9FIRM|nr:DUF6465 family protein [Caproicibacterium lactatifermentans]ARP49425.1 hypothetical protein B6259_00080 [Ruminococcaceae bacterium CPB6]MDD4807241.1 DUF6465 family protein [Oscillospiraceae bacterium]QKN23017.1 hypothetical protein GJQ69_00080 [Caproicibacterium lactatifermentans]QKO30377.1 hypothetical protein GKP14_04700 [Caproicibacterium lactatifermentans]
MDTKKKLTKQDLKDKLEPVSEAMAKASQTVSDMARETAGKAASAARDAAEKAEPTVKAVGQTIRDTGKKATEAGRRAASALVPEVYVQWGNREVQTADLIERAKTDYHMTNKGAIYSCRLYVKPEDGIVYYVINGKEGKIYL